MGIITKRKTGFDTSFDHVKDVASRLRTTALQITLRVSAFIYIFLRALRCCSNSAYMCMNGFNADVYRLLNRDPSFYPPPLLLLSRSLARSLSLSASIYATYSKHSRNCIYSANGSHSKVAHLTMVSSSRLNGRVRVLRMTRS